MKNIKTKRLPVFKTIHEESDYWDKHDLTEHLDEFKPVSMKLRGPAKHLLSIRIDSKLIGTIREIADKKGIPYQTLMQKWLAERAEAEVPALDPAFACAASFAVGMGEYESQKSQRL